MRVTYLGVVVVAWVAIVATVVHAAPPNSPNTWTPSSVVVLTLRPPVANHRSQFLVQDIASLEGGTFQDRQKIGKLDLIDMPSPGKEVTISREQVMYRLLIAGIEGHQFRIEGPPVVRVSRQGFAPPLLQVSAVGTTEPQQPHNPAPRLLRQEATGTNNSIANLVKRNDVVQMVTNIGELKVVTHGEAMEDGRLGQLIRLRNVDSSRVVHGRVVDRAVVEVDFVRSKP